MITQKTARAIYNCYSELLTVDKLLTEINQIEEQAKQEREKPGHRDEITEKYEVYELGVPSNYSSSYSSKRLFQVKPALAKSVILAHQAAQKALLVELNEQARIEIEMEVSNVT